MLSKKIILFLIGIAVVTIVIMSGNTEHESKSLTPVTQKDLQDMVANWMSNPDKNDTNQRLEIMKAYYAFQESGQSLTNDQNGRVLENQIRKMVSINIPVEELNQIKQSIREELK